MILFKISIRNVFRQKRRTILTLMTMFGGFVLSALSIGWADGTYSQIIYSFTKNRMGQIQIHDSGYLDKPSIYKIIENYQEIGAKIDKIDKVDSWTPRIFAGALGMVDENVSGIEVIGIDPVLEDRTTNFNNKIIKGSPLNRDISGQAIIGEGLAKIIKADIGDSIVLLSQASDGSIANAKYQIVGIINSGDPIGDRASCYLSIEDAQQLFVLNGSCHEIAIVVDKMTNINTVTNDLRNKFIDNNLDVEPWTVFAKSFYKAMKADLDALWIQLGIIILLVAVGVLNTVMMSVLERRREFGLLKAIGTKPGQIISLILIEMNIIAIFSIILGIAVGLVGLYFLSVKGITLSDPMSYGGIVFSSLKAEINMRAFIIPAITILFSTTIVSLFPAIKAARTDPAKTMRIN